MLCCSELQMSQFLERARARLSKLVRQHASIYRESRQVVVCLFLHFHHFPGVLLAPSPERIQETTANDLRLDTNSNAQVLEVVHNEDDPKASLSTARTAAFLDTPVRIWTKGLIGCTSVAIVSEAGAWLSHFWEAPSFVFQNDFETQVIDAIKNGAGEKMPGAYELGRNGGYLDPSNNVQIFIMTPAGDDGETRYPDKIAQLENVLTGDDSPWSGAEVTTHLYEKPDTSDLDPEAMDYQRRFDEIMLNYHCSPAARGRMLIEYDNHQDHDPHNDDLDAPVRAHPKAIWRVWMESENHLHEWDPRANQQPGTCDNGNRKRDGSCTTSRSASITADSPSTTGTAPETTGSGQRGSTTTSKQIVPARTPSTGSTITPAPLASKTVGGKGSVTPVHCRHVAKPEQNTQYCLCGTDGVQYPMMSYTTGMTAYDPCGYTMMPTVTATTQEPFKTTLSDGRVVQCASSTYYNYAVNTAPLCAGPTTVVSTVPSIASAYYASSASAADASWSAAAATPSAECTILWDDFVGDSMFWVSGINGWAGDNGSELEDQFGGDCGLVSGWVWEERIPDSFQGRDRYTQYAAFVLSFFRAGCVEDAVRSAGGPDLSCNTPDSLSDQESYVMSQVEDRAAEESKELSQGTIP